MRSFTVSDKFNATKDHLLAWSVSRSLLIASMCTGPWDANNISHAWSHTSSVTCVIDIGLHQHRISKESLPFSCLPHFWGGGRVVVRKSGIHQLLQWSLQAVHCMQLSSSGTDRHLTNLNAGCVHKSHFPGYARVTCVRPPQDG